MNLARQIKSFGKGTGPADVNDFRQSGEQLEPRSPHWQRVEYFATNKSRVSTQHMYHS